MAEEEVKANKAQSSKPDLYSDRAALYELARIPFQLRPEIPFDWLWSCHAQRGHSNLRSVAPESAYLVRNFWECKVGCQKAILHQVVA